VARQAIWQSQICREGATDAPVPDIDTDLLQFLGHSGPAVAAQAQARLFLSSRDIAAQFPAGHWICASTTMSVRCLRLAGRLWKARNPRGLTFMT